jgi:hypothetical protein
VDAPRSRCRHTGVREAPAGRFVPDAAVGYLEPLTPHRLLDERGDTRSGPIAWPIYRWSAGMTSATQALHDLVTGKNNQVVEVPGAVWAQPSATRAGPSSRQFTDMPLVPLGPGRRFCLLCVSTDTQKLNKGFSNYLTHLHDDCLAEYRFRCAPE